MGGCARCAEQHDALGAHPSLLTLSRVRALAVSLRRAMVPWFRVQARSTAACLGCRTGPRARGALAPTQACFRAESLFSSPCATLLIGTCSSVVCFLFPTVGSASTDWCLCTACRLPHNAAWVKRDGLRYPTVEKLNQQINNMTLVEGTGGEDDAFNVVYIYDSLALPFHRAEQFMQVGGGGRSPATIRLYSAPIASHLPMPLTAAPAVSSDSRHRSAWSLPPPFPVSLLPSAVPLQLFAAGVRARLLDRAVRLPEGARPDQHDGLPRGRPQLLRVPLFFVTQALLPFCRHRPARVPV